MKTTTTATNTTNATNATNNVDFAFLDSGIGGLPYMCYLREKYPESSCVYLADTEHFPYGVKTPEQITSYVDGCVRLLINHFNPATIVIACNTMSVVALETMRHRFDVPFVGTVPAIKLATAVTQNHRIGLLATDRTVSDSYTAQLIKDFASDCTVFSRGDAPLIEFIEKKLVTATPDERVATVMPAVSYFKHNGVDTIVLACTHYTNMVDDFKKAAGEGVKIIDSRDGVARQAMVMRRTSNKATASCEAPTTATGKTTDGVKLFLSGSFYITGGISTSDEDNYRLMSKRLGIPWGGTLA